MFFSLLPFKAYYKVIIKSDFNPSRFRGKPLLIDPEMCSQVSDYIIHPLSIQNGKNNPKENRLLSMFPYQKSLTLGSLAYFSEKLTNILNIIIHKPKENFSLHSFLNILEKVFKKFYKKIIRFKSYPLANLISASSSPPVNSLSISSIKSCRLSIFVTATNAPIFNADKVFVPSIQLLLVFN